MLFAGKKGKRPRAVLDTNVIVSGLWNPKGTPADVLRAWRKNAFILITSPSLLNELQDVLQRPRIRKNSVMTPRAVRQFFIQTSKSAFIVSGLTDVRVVEDDPSDDVVIACALDGAADYIVTGDKKHLLPLKEYQGIRIVTAKDFLRQL